MKQGSLFDADTDPADEPAPESRPRGRAKPPARQKGMRPLPDALSAAEGLTRQIEYLHPLRDVAASELEQMLAEWALGTCTEDELWRFIRGSLYPLEPDELCQVGNWLVTGKDMPEQYAKPFEEVQLMPDRLRDPLSWRKPCRVFVNSVSDLFHKDVPFEYVAKVFAIMQLASRHTFQVLTKRPERMREFFEKYRHWSGQIDSCAKSVDDMAIGMMDGKAPNQPGWPLPNVWLGVSVENQATADERIPHLLSAPVRVRFLSCEPLLGPIEMVERFSDGAYRNWLTGQFHNMTANMDDGSTAIVETNSPELPRVNWVIVGGESGPGARPFDLEWARLLVKQCKAANVACFVKQLGAKPIGRTPTISGPRELPVIHDPDNSLKIKDKKGGDPTEWPADLRIREFPKVA
jgi:protein gp37